MSLNVVILAAGKGTRMRSSLPKVLHPVASKPMVSHVIETARQIGAELFVSHETVRSHLKRIYRKLGVHDRAAALQRAHDEHILV